MPPSGPLQNSVRGELVEPLSLFLREEKAFDTLRPNGFLDASAPCAAGRQRQKYVENCLARRDILEIRDIRAPPLALK
jgi:hypothetical protein